MTKNQKENVWYIAVILGVLLVMVSEYFGASALVFGPVMLIVVFVGFWVFDVK